jgi:hypothetical protein
MEYLHVRNLEKYHQGYKDRKLIWAKIYFNMVQGDPDCEMITNEIDWSRLIKFILLELQAQKPIPLDEKYLSKKGFDLKQRKMSLTLQSLQQFIEVRYETVTEPLQSCNLDKIREDIDKSRLDVCSVPEQQPIAVPKKIFSIPTPEEVQEYINLNRLPVNANKFHAYYTSNGWKVGKNPMKNWKAAIVSWSNKD